MRAEERKGNEKSEEGNGLRLVGVEDKSHHHALPASPRHAMLPESHLLLATTLTLAPATPTLTFVEARNFVSVFF